MKFFKIIGVLLILSVATVSQGDPSCCGSNMGDFSGWIIQCGSSGCDFVAISGSGGWTCMLVACCFVDPNCAPQSWLLLNKKIWKS